MPSRCRRTSSTPSRRSAIAPRAESCAPARAARAPVPRSCCMWRRTLWLSTNQSRRLRGAQPRSVLRREGNPHVPTGTDGGLLRSRRWRERFMACDLWLANAREWPRDRALASRAVRVSGCVMHALSDERRQTRIAAWARARLSKNVWGLRFWRVHSVGAADVVCAVRWE